MVDVIVIPPSDARERKYEIAIIASASEIRKVATIEFEIKGISHWLWVGIGVVAVVVAAFAIVFWRVGRRG
jgi:uncharacterized membrane protein